MLTPIALLLVFLVVQDPSPAPAPSAPSPAPEPPAAEMKPAPDGAVLSIETSMGTIEVGLFASKAPRSARNFLNYAKSGFYDGTIFHRVIPGFMIQGGGLDAKMSEKETGPPVRNEARNGLLNSRGTLAMARTDDPQSATSQFFINLKDNPSLDFGIARDGWGYTVFGEVLSGMEVVDQIAAVRTTRMIQYENVPVTPVVIRKIRVVSEPKPPASAPRAPTKPASPGAPPAKPKASPAPQSR